MSGQYHERNANRRRLAFARAKWFPDDVTEEDRALLVKERPDFFAPVDAKYHLYDARGCPLTGPLAVSRR